MRFYLRNDFPDRPETYYVCWTEHGRPRRRSTGTRDHKLAQEALAKHILEHDQPRDQRAAEVTVTSVVLRYWQHRGRKLASKDTVRRALRAVTTHLALVTIADFTVPVQERFVELLRAEGHRDNTIDRWVGVVQSALNWAQDRGEVRGVPAKLRRPRAADGEGERPATIEELRALCAAATQEHHRRFLALAIGTAGRPNALLDLDWSRVNFDEHTVDLRNPAKAQNTKRRARVPMAPTLEAFLAERKSVGPVIQWRGKALKGHRTAYDTLAELAGVTAGAYGLRKAVATWMRREGVPEWDVQGMLGHRTGRGITDRYAHWRPEYMRAAADSVERLFRVIGAAWLASPLPVSGAPQRISLQVPIAIGETGGRTWDRTTDPYHVKDQIEAAIQSLAVANDD